MRDTSEGRRFISLSFLFSLVRWNEPPPFPCQEDYPLDQQITNYALQDIQIKDELHFRLHYLDFIVYDHHQALNSFRLHYLNLFSIYKGLISCHLFVFRKWKSLQVLQYYPYSYNLGSDRDGKRLILFILFSYLLAIK